MALKALPWISLRVCLTIPMTAPWDGDWKHLHLQRLILAAPHNVQNKCLPTARLPYHIPVECSCLPRHCFLRRRSVSTRVTTPKLSLRRYRRLSTRCRMLPTRGAGQPQQRTSVSWHTPDDWRRPTGTATSAQASLLVRSRLASTLPALVRRSDLHDDNKLLNTIA